MKTTLLALFIFSAIVHSAENSTFPDKAVKIKERYDEEINKIRLKQIEELEGQMKLEGGMNNFKNVEIIKEMIARIPKNPLVEPYSIGPNNFISKIIDTTWIWNGGEVKFANGGQLKNTWGDVGRDVKWKIEGNKIIVVTSDNLKHKFTYLSYGQLQGFRDDGYKFIIRNKSVTK